MRLAADFRTIHAMKWHEYAVRFVFGGVITVVAGVIAKVAGPAFGGLFLAFPAILPASLTLIEKHTQRRRRDQGVSGTKSGRRAAALDAAGAAMGGLGLFAFAFSVSALLPQTSAWIALSIATIAWGAVSFAIWKSCRG